MCCALTISVHAQDIHIPDPNLRAAVREELKLPAGAPVTQADMLNLINLNARNWRGIENIDGLEYATHLTYLRLGGFGNYITDLTPLTNLRLKELWLYGNHVSDLSPLSGMTSLTHLGLAYNKVSDISVLANLTNLTWLELQGNYITDVTALATLTHLDRLALEDNAIIDHTPLDGVSLGRFTYDQTCDMPQPPLQPRLENRSFPSLSSSWGTTAINQPHLTYLEKLAQYDLFFSGLGEFHLDLTKVYDRWVVRGNLKDGMRKQNNLRKLNPNMIFLASITAVWEDLNAFPKESPYWERDAQGRIIEVWDHAGILNLNHPGVQKYIIDRAVAVSECGLYDGIWFDGWDDTELHPRVEQILQGIRARVPSEFLIVVNAGRLRTPLSAPYINGIFTEPGILDVYNYPLHKGVSAMETRLDQLEDIVSWSDDNLKAPQINLLETDGLFHEPVDSPANRRWMRVTTTLGLTRSNGYVFYNVHNQAREHYWYDFWNADLGRPLGPKSTLYDDDIPGLYIREYTNGWAVYNHSGAPQVITLPEEAQGVASGVVNIKHPLPNLDGEMYLRAKPANPADVNKDGVVNILDLTIVAQGLGTDSLKGDVNGDGVVNILDLVFVADQF